MIFSVVILAVSLSIDALGVGIVYGLRKITIPMASKLIICFFSIAYSAAALYLGKSLSNVIPTYFSRLIGISILILMGIWIIIQALLKKEINETKTNNTVNYDEALFRIAIKSLGITVQIIRNPVEGDLDKSGVIDVSESLLLGLALSVDAIGVGVGSALAGFDSMFIPFSVGLFQLAFLYAGTYFGDKFAMFKRLNKKLLAVLPGILLFVLAIIRIW